VPGTTIRVPTQRSGCSEELPQLRNNPVPTGCRHGDSETHAAGLPVWDYGVVRRLMLGCEDDNRHAMPLGGIVGDLLIWAGFGFSFSEVEAAAKVMMTSKRLRHWSMASLTLPAWRWRASGWDLSPRAGGTVAARAGRGLRGLSWINSNGGRTQSFRRLIPLRSQGGAHSTARV